MSLAGAHVYYTLTYDIAEAIVIMFEAGFPEVYKKYQQTSNMSIWVEEDSGPFLEWAIIYKLQDKLHKDWKDLGPSACFPTGSFKESEMLFS